jgi:pimeloyl-ACP methyl ester carboxylesterase
MQWYRPELVPLAWGVYAVGLVPEDRAQPPILAFPGTSPKTEFMLKGATILADLDPLGPGYSLSRASAHHVRAWLQEVSRSSDSRAVLVGHSLGGALAIQAAVRCPGLVKSVTTFNSPMVSHSIVAKWKETPEEDRAQIINLFRKGDLVARLGPAEIGQSFEIATTGSHNEDFLDGRPIDSVRKVERTTTPIYRTLVQGFILALAFALVGLVSLLLRLTFLLRAERLHPDATLAIQTAEPTREGIQSAAQSGQDEAAQSSSFSGRLDAQVAEEGVQGTILCA